MDRVLAAKEVLDAEVIVVADGPGNLGTETTWGVSALGSGHALMAAATLQADRPRAPGELRRRAGAAPRRLASLTHDPGRCLQGRCERSGSGAPTKQQRSAVRDALRSRQLGGDPPSRRGRRSPPAVEELRARGVDVRRWDAGSKTTRVLPRGRRGRAPRRPDGRREPPLASADRLCRFAPAPFPQSIRPQTEPRDDEPDQE